MAKGHLFFQLKMIRKGSKPPIWRRGIVPANITFAQLALVLEEMLELPKLESYEFEFYQKKDRLLEWHVGAAWSDFYYDYRNAPDQFINEWMKKEKWFYFRILETEDRLPEYRIEIEKEMRGPTLSSDNSLVECPLMIYNKMPEDDPFWKHTDQINDYFRQFYHLEKRAAEYLPLKELLEEIFEQRKGLGYCTRMVNRDDHTKESSHHALQNAAKAFNSFSKARRSAEQMQDMDEEGEDEYAQWLINFLLGEKEHRAQGEKTGQEGNGGLAGSSRDGIADSDGTKQEGNAGSDGPGQKDNAPVCREEKMSWSGMPRQRSTVEKALLAYTFKELQEQAESLNLHVTGRTKAKVAFEIARYLLEPDHMRKELLNFSEEELDAFERLIENPFSRPSDEDEMNLKGLWDLGYVMVYIDGTYEVPEDAETIYNIIKRNGYRDYHRKAVWLLDCLTAFILLYMVAPAKILYQLYEREESLKVPYTEFVQLFEKLPDDRNLCCMMDGKVLVKEFLEDDLYKKIEGRCLEGMEFYILTKEEINCLARYGYPSSTKEYQLLCQFFQNNLGMDEKTSISMRREANTFFTSGVEPSQYIEQLKKRRPDLLDGEDAGDFQDLLCQVEDHTRMVYFRGHTPMEVLEDTQKLAGETQALKEEIQKLEEEIRRLTEVNQKKAEELRSLREENQNAAGLFGTQAGALPSASANKQPLKKPEPAKKIYPNDPCPCGSGKKYKKCCGRR
ncbi:MAG: SEC-C domain-containing protein [Lachnospiraceae bacterium]|nr:SEC-C domain-containing protein [Lachnospiraceae bacterium]